MVRTTHKDNFDSKLVISDMSTSPFNTLPHASTSKSVRCGRPEMKLSPSSSGSSMLGSLPQKPVTEANVLRGLL